MESSRETLNSKSSKYGSKTFNSAKCRKPSSEVATSSTGANLDLKSERVQVLRVEPDQKRYRLPPDDPALYNEYFPPEARVQIRSAVKKEYANIEMCNFHVAKLELIFSHDHSDPLPSIREVSETLQVPEERLLISKLQEESPVVETSLVGSIINSATDQLTNQSTLGLFASLVLDGTTYGLTTGHGWTDHSNIETHNHRVLGRVEAIILEGNSRADPEVLTCDVALIKIQENEDFCNSVTGDDDGSLRYLRFYPGQVDERVNEKLEKFQDGAGDSSGRVILIDYSNMRHPQYCGCIALESEDDDFHRAGESGLVLTRLPKIVNGIKVVEGVAMLLAKQTLHGRKLTIAQPLKSTIRRIKEGEDNQHRYGSLQIHRSTPIHQCT